MNSATKKNTRDVGMTCPSAKLARAVQMQDSLNPGLHPKEMDKKTQDFLYEKKTKKSNRQRHPQALLLPSPVHTTLSPASLKFALDLLTRLQSDKCMPGYLHPTAYTNVVISVNAGRRITQGKTIDTGDSRGEVVIPYWLSRGRAKRAIGAEFQVRHLLNFYTSNV
ncbi:UNVERIFIED_CONTAM: hypothetical protein FKN15_053595 [Acipenser sinensis]